MVVPMLLLASGRTADVFALGDDRVLRRYRDGWSAVNEAAVMAYVGGLGYPVPTVYEVDGPDMVMERIEGPTLIEAMIAGRISPSEGIATLADLHLALHALPARLSEDPGDRVLHLDLHIENVIMGTAGPVVIDWSNATDGPPGLDVALSALIMAEVAVFPGHDMAALAAAAVPEFLALTGVPAPDMVERAVAMRTANPTLSAEEKARLATASAMLS
jgi:aminoglycoside phosphotransferase (APT) family kinase protein